MYVLVATAYYKPWEIPYKNNEGAYRKFYIEPLRDTCTKILFHVFDP